MHTVDSHQASTTPSIFHQLLNAMVILLLIATTWQVLSIQTRRYRKWEGYIGTITNVSIKDTPEDRFWFWIEDWVIPTGIVVGMSNFGLALVNVPRIFGRTSLLNHILFCFEIIGLLAIASVAFSH